MLVLVVLAAGAVVAGVLVARDDSAAGAGSPTALCPALIGSRAVAYRTVSSGTVAGVPWRFQVIAGAQDPVQRFEARVLLGVRRFGLCPPWTLQLIDRLNRPSIGFGFALGRPYNTVEIGLGRGVAPIRPPAHDFPGGEFFIFELPGSACDYPVVDVELRSGTSFASFAGAFGRCRGGAGPVPPAPSTPAGTYAITIPPPRALSSSARAEFVAGRTVALQSGCLACHRIGVNGNPGPGEQLDRIGLILSTRALRVALVRPTIAPMPSFQNLPPAKLNDLIAFLHDLR